MSGEKTTNASEVAAQATDVAAKAADVASEATDVASKAANVAAGTAAIVTSTPANDVQALAQIEAASRERREDKDRDARIAAEDKIREEQAKRRTEWYDFAKQVLGVVSPVIVAIGTVVAVWRTGTIQDQQTAQKVQIQEYDHKVNSRMDQLIEKTEQIARAAGVAEGKAMQKAKEDK